jgi:hypothetical protein
MSARAEEGSNTSTVALRVARGDEKCTQSLGIKLRHPVSGEYKYGDLPLQAEGVSNLRQTNMVMSPAELRTKNDFADETQQQL